jgi:hypothetical protein
MTKIQMCDPAAVVAYIDHMQKHSIIDIVVKEP